MKLTELMEHEAHVLFSFVMILRIGACTTMRIRVSRIYVSIFI